MLRSKDRVGQLAPGFHADVIAINGDPVADISHIVDRKRLAMVMKNGKIFSYHHREYEPRRVSDFAMASWNDLYTQDRVADLRSKGAIK